MLTGRKSPTCYYHRKSLVDTTFWKVGSLLLGSAGLQGNTTGGTDGSEIESIRDVSSLGLYSGVVGIQDKLLTCRPEAHGLPAGPRSGQPVREHDKVAPYILLCVMG